MALRLSDMPKEQANLYLVRILGSLVLLLVLAPLIMQVPNSLTSIVLCIAWLAAMGAWILLTRRLNRRLWGRSTNA